MYGSACPRVPSLLHAPTRQLIWLEENGSLSALKIRSHSAESADVDSVSAADEVTSAGDAVASVASLVFM